jgi:hypothetical protein
MCCRIIGNNILMSYLGLIVLFVIIGRIKVQWEDFCWLFHRLTTWNSSITNFWLISDCRKSTACRISSQLKSTQWNRCHSSSKIFSIVSPINLHRCSILSCTQRWEINRLVDKSVWIYFIRMIKRRDWYH